VHAVGDEWMDGWKLLDATDTTVADDNADESNVNILCVS